MTNRTAVKSIFMCASLITYIIALFFAGFNYEYSHKEPLWGYLCLALGMLTVEFIPQQGNPFPFLAWLSNLPFFLSLIILLFVRKEKGYKRLFILMLTALILSFGAFIPGQPDKHNHLVPGAGCYLWILSYAILIAGIRYMQSRSPEIAA